MRFFKILTFPAIFLFILFGSVVSVSAQNEPEDLANAIMERFLENEKPSVVLSESLSDFAKQLLGVSLTNSLTTADGQFTTLGKPFEYELLEHEEYTSRVAYLKYALYFNDSLFVVWLYYYKTPEEWQLNTWYFESNIMKASND